MLWPLMVFRFRKGVRCSPYRYKKTPQNTARIDRKAAKVQISRGFVRTILLTNIARA
jgi:uncharacterized protein (UPF0128 family)